MEAFHRPRVAEGPRHAIDPGLDAAQVSQVVAGCLRDGYLADPRVTARIAKRSDPRVGVAGAVSAPKTLEDFPGMTLSQAIIDAGGLSCSADVPLRPLNEVFVGQLP